VRAEIGAREEVGRFVGEAVVRVVVPAPPGLAAGGEADGERDEDDVEVVLLRCGEDLVERIHSALVERSD
jgi:hypothetical protein